MAFDDRKLVRIIESWPVCRITKEPAKLASGEESHAYFDWGGPLGHIKTPMMIARMVLDFADEHRLYANQFLGVPEGMTGFANYCNLLKGAAAYATVRKVPKSQGSFAERHYVFAPKGKVLVLDDTLTRGGSVAKVLDTLLEDPDAEAIGVLVLMNRMAIRPDGRTAEEFFKLEYALPTYWLSEAAPFIPEAYARALPGLGERALPIKRSLEREFRINI